MRTRLPAFALLAFALASPAAAGTRNFGITGFEKIRVDGPFKVTLTTGVAPFARATGSATALDRLSIEVRGTTLLVRNAVGSWGGYPGADPGPVDITLGTHDLSAVWLNGSGSISINRVKGLTFELGIQGSGLGEIADVAVDQLSVTAAGSANIRLAGQAAKTTSVVRGLSTLQATDLKVKDADITADGAATIDANVSNSAKINAAGPATIRLTGSPACTARTSGSASVSGCHSPQ
jgi:hypothetical protein